MESIIKSCLDSHYHNVKVLYVEDDKFSREKLMRILDRRFANVLVAIDGEEGYKLYNQYHPDIIIIDIKMDKMNGLDMIEKIRQENEKIQIIVTTAYEDSEFLLQSIENNVNHFILKPIDLEKFLLAIQKSIYHIEIEKELEKQKKLTKAIMDYQDSLIFIVENKQIIEVNRPFSTFTGLDIINGSSIKTVSRLFVNDAPYFYPQNQEKWTDEFLSVHNGKAKVKWRGKGGMEGIFLMKVNQIPNENQYLFTCTNITELEIEIKKNELLASVDPMTKIYNRIKLDEILTSEMIQAEENKTSLSIIMVEIDNLKKINDEYGHLQGDEVLITFSTIVQQRIRESDIFGRWGGKEFFIITPNEDKQIAAELAESVRILIKEFHFPSVRSITCSFGVAEYVSGKTKKQLIKEASMALWESQTNGKNTVTIFMENKEGASRV